MKVCNVLEIYKSMQCSAFENLYLILVVLEMEKINRHEPGSKELGHLVPVHKVLSL